MIDYIDYVPVLRGKTAEFGALGSLSGEARKRTKPLIEISPLTIDEQTEEPVKSLEDHLGRAVRALRENWSDQQQTIFDQAQDPSVLLYDARRVSDARTTSGEHAISFLHSGLRSCGIVAIPVMRLDDDRDYLHEVGLVAGDNGVCLRMDRNQFTSHTRLMAELFARTLELGIGPEQIDLVVDLQSLAEEDGPSAVLLVQAALEAMPEVASWRSIVVVGSSFPSLLSGSLNRHESKIIRRAEWEMHSSLIDAIEYLPRVPAFGDYGIEGFSGEEEGPAPRVIQGRISASIRYTGLGGWFVIRGGPFEEHGKEQYHKLAQEVVGSPHWRSESFSWGDRYIGECARQQEGPGTPQKWRQVAVSHHITSVNADLASLFGL